MTSLVVRGRAPRRLAHSLAIAALACELSVAAANPSPIESVNHHSVYIDGVRVAYREAGRRSAPTLLLLHGFPTSSFMYRDLMPRLADRWHVIAPDYPGFGDSDFPPAGEYEYSFAQLTRTVDKFTTALGLTKYALYIQDYGAPVGLRLALAYPERVTALIVQNGNAYEEGFSAAWDPLKAYWRDPTRKNREQLRGWLTAEGMRQQYVAGMPESELARFAPETWTLDWARLSRPGNIDMQIALFGDYRRNVELYPRFQAYLRKWQPPTLIVWGRHDPFFTEAGARAWLRDLPDAELHLLDAGHFALETRGVEIATLLRDFLARRLTSGVVGSPDAQLADPEARR
jgi:pimeloyl-ACP methyl ester carboxylesterase